MGRLNKTRRRWLGAGCLVAALALLLAGQTVLRDRLSPVLFLLYWLACLGLTVGAIVMALLDVFAVRSEIRQDQHALLESTLREIEARKRRSAGDGTQGPPGRGLGS